LKSFYLPNNAARLVVLQRIELISSFLKKIRKLFGRNFFTNIITKYFLNSKHIGIKYYEVMQNEFHTFKEYINFDEDKLFLSIGGGLGGLELVINENLSNKDYYFIERNFVSKKVNNLAIQKEFLENNGMRNSQINIFDYDKDKLPVQKFDVIISLLSLDYHYDFEVYIEYLREISNPNTKIIFDTIRHDHFLKIFKNVKVLATQENTTHKSKRILCSQFLK
jgi:SAM-dependent methyltransferase